MKIAFVSTMEGGPWGGSEELWSQAAERLIRHGVTVGASVLGWPEMPPPLARLASDGMVLVRRRADVAGRVLRRVQPEHDVRWLDRFQPDLVVISQGIAFDESRWMAACAQRKIPYACIVHAATEFDWPDSSHIPAFRQGYGKAAAVFFVSHANRNLVETQMAQSLAQGEIVRNPFNVSYDATPPWPAPQDSVFRLACVGRLAPGDKGQDLLFDVLARDHWRRRPLQVTLFGRGPNEQTLRELAEMRGLSQVRFGGFVRNIETLWAEYHALILPSRMEGLPISIVEAMLCGRPCIVTDVAGNAELIEDNISGFVAAAPKPDLLDEALERAWKRREEWRQIGQTAAAKVRRLVPRDPIQVFVDRVLALGAS